jgi:hypothetical protein
VAQSIGPEFKPQHCKKKKTKQKVLSHTSMDDTGSSHSFPGRGEAAPSSRHTGPFLGSLRFSPPGLAPHGFGWGH